MDVEATAFNLFHYASSGLSSSNTPDRVSVFTWTLNSSGAPTLADHAFFVQVVC